MDENIKIIGHLFAIVEKIDGNKSQLIQIIDSKNQIVNGMLDLISKKLANNTTDNITKISFGTNTIAPSRTDTISIMTNKFTKDLSGSAENTEYNKTKYSFTLEPAEHNGFDITEYALTTEAGDIVCRITRGLVRKTDNIRISGAWTIIVDIGV